MLGLFVLLSMPPIVGTAFERAEIRLERMGYDLTDVDASTIVLRPTAGRIPCAERSALGCFQVLKVELPNGDHRLYGVLHYAMVHSGSITHSSKVRTVLEHEAIHALLWLLKDEMWNMHDRRFP